MASYSFLGLTVDALTLDALVEIVDRAFAEHETYVIGHHNLHSLYIHHRDRLFRRFYERADYVHVDGAPLIWAGRVLGHALTREHRLTSLDFFNHILARCVAEGRHVFLLGGRPGVAEAASARCAADFPGLRLRAHHGYFDASAGNIENEQVLRAINDHRPHVLLVGMGMPRQERWILENVDRLDANTVWSVGALMDYLAGANATPPRWMGRWGLEWLFRLVSEPRRLWKRYLLEPWLAAWLLVGELARRRAR